MSAPFEVIPYTGGKITVPGIYSGVPMRETDTSPGYHGDICAGPSFSSSALRLADEKSLDEVWDACYLNPDRAPEKDAKFFAQGRAAHTLLLGEPGFREQFVIRPDTYTDEKTGAEKPWFATATPCKRWMAEAAKIGKTVLTTEQLENVRGMAKRMMAEPIISEAGLLNGLIEHSLFWQDEKTGLWLKARPDTIPTHSRVISDLKTSAEVQWEDCERAIGNHRYNMQMALIAEGMEILTGFPTEEAYLIFIKTGRPWSINVTPLDGETMLFGRMQNRRAIDQIAECLKTGHWPGPADSEVTKGLPPFMRKRLQKQHEDGLLPEVEAPKPYQAAKPRTSTAATLPDDAEAI